MVVLFSLMIAWSFFEAGLWSKIFIATSSIAGFLVSLGVIWAKAISPLLAKPLAKAMKREFRDEVREVIVEPETLAIFGDLIEEKFAYEASAIMDHVAQLGDRYTREIETISYQLSKMEHNQQTYIKELKDIKEGFGLQ